VTYKFRHVDKSTTSGLGNRFSKNFRTEGVSYIRDRRAFQSKGTPRVNRWFEKRDGGGRKKEAMRSIQSTGLNPTNRIRDIPAMAILLRPGGQRKGEEESNGEIFSKLGGWGALGNGGKPKVREGKVRKRGQKRLFS